MDFDATGQLLIVYSAFVKDLRKNGNTTRQCIGTFIDFKKACDLVRREVLYDILIEFGILMILVRLIKIGLNETYGRVRGDKNLSGLFSIKNGFRQGDAISSLLFNYSLEYAIIQVQVNQDGLKLNGTHQLLFYADVVNILGGSVHNIKEKAETLEVASKEI